MLLPLGRILVWALTIGGIAFAAGFLGPIVLDPEANQGPLLGIFITGPLGLVAGFVVGLIREFAGRTATPREMLRGSTTDWRLLRRLLAGGGALLLLYSALKAMPDGVDRSVAGSLVLAAVLLWYAAAGRMPGWFR